MPSLRHLWFDNRHLLGDAAGQALLAELEALGARPRETILATGDRLAALSLSLAQTFCRSAPAAWRAFGAKGFPRWVKIGERLASEEPASRDGATAYFTIAPHLLSSLGLDLAEEWAAIGRDTLKVSGRLGTQFLQTSAPLLALLPAPLRPGSSPTETAAPALPTSRTQPAGWSKTSTGQSLAPADPGWPRLPSPHP